MIERQQIILNFLSLAGGPVSRALLGGWVFVLVKGQQAGVGLEPLYSFFPGPDGPCSSALNHEVDGLISAGYIQSPNGEDLQLRPGIPHHGLDSNYRLVREITALVDRYPRGANAELAGWVRALDPLFAANPRPAGPLAVYTIGCEGWQVDAFLNQLLLSGIRTIMDVRSDPQSRIFGFQKGVLASCASQAGIAVQAFPQLGAQGALSLRAGPGEIEAYLDQFDARLRKEEPALNSAAAGLLSQAGVLLGTDRDPRRCHRSRLAERLAQITALPVVHLTA